MDPTPDSNKETPGNVTVSGGNVALGEQVRVFRLSIINIIAGIVIGSLLIALGLGISIPLYLWHPEPPNPNGDTGKIVLSGIVFVLFFPFGVFFLVWVPRSFFVRIVVYDMGFIRACRGKSDAYLWHEITAVEQLLINGRRQWCVVTRGDGTKIKLRDIAISDLKGLVECIIQGTALHADLCVWETKRLSQVGYSILPSEWTFEVVGKLQGTWRTVSGEVNGEKLDEELCKVLEVVCLGCMIERKRFRYVFVCHGCVVEVLGPAEILEQYAKASFKIDPTTAPKTFQGTIREGARKGAVFEGIYELDGDTLKVCAKPTGQSRWPSTRPEWEGPAVFATKAGSNMVSLVLMREVR
jgi:uncharacterized protein (TIGR03067 family)